MRSARIQDVSMTTSQSEHHTRAIYELLGQMVSMAAHLELRLQVLATRLVETPYAAHWINGQNSSVVIKLLRDVAKEHPGVSPDRLNDLQAILAECAHLFNRRHGYVHGVWSVDHTAPDGSAVLKTMRLTRGKHTPTFAPLSLDDLANLIHGLDEVTTQVMSWFIDHVKATSVSPGDTAVNDLDD